MTVLFRNVIPQKDALALIDKERHPRVFKYAEASTEKNTSASTRRLKLWIEGYKRFGDVFEETLGTHGRRFRRALSLGRALEENLPDRWMLVGLRTSELPEGVQLFLHAFRNNGNYEGERAREFVAQMYMTNQKWNPEHDAVLAWMPKDELRDSFSKRAKWADAIKVFCGQAEPWTMDEALTVLDTIPYDEAKRLHKVTALKDPRKMLLHYTEGMPIEFLAAM